jgi:two-component system, cell cycle response regulator DivK
MPHQSILIVDDHSLNIELASILLKKEGFQVYAADCAKSALECLRVKKPDLILMDVRMPDIDGLTLTRQLRKSPETKNLVIIAFSAFLGQEDEEKIFEAGCDGLISKPIEVMTFAKTIHRHLIQKSQSELTEAATSQGAI